MQKDGGLWRPSRDCKYVGRCGDTCGEMIRPKEAALLLHEDESKYCLPDYPDRHVIDLQGLGLSENVFSLIFIIKIAQYMGCNQFFFVACDAHATGSLDTYVPGKGLDDCENQYAGQREKLKPFIKDLDCKWITPGPQNGHPIMSFGVIVNDIQRLNMCLKQSQIAGDMHYIKTPDSATKGLNKLLDIIEADGADVAILTHQDMHYRKEWLPQVKVQLAKLPDDWIVAGIIGKDSMGRICGRMHDTRIPACFETSHIHKFPHPVCCFDECCIIVNIKSGFRFDEELDGFDLYGTLCVLQAWEMGGTAWVIDAFAEHYCTRPFSWMPDEKFMKNYKWLYDRFNELGGRLDSTAMGLSETDSEKVRVAFMTSAAS